MRINLLGFQYLNGITNINSPDSEEDRKRDYNIDLINIPFECLSHYHLYRRIPMPHYKVGT